VRREWAKGGTPTMFKDIFDDSPQTKILDFLADHAVFSAATINSNRKTD